jgi:hypothetical protein
MSGDSLSHIGPFVHAMVPTMTVEEDVPYQGDADPRARLVPCCGCGITVDQTNPRCEILFPDDDMGTYGPCCAYLTKKERREWEQRQDRVIAGKKLPKSRRRK